MGDDAETDDFFGDDDGEAMFTTWQDFNLNFRWIQSGTNEKTQYLPSYTHPSQPDPGLLFFTSYIV